MRDGRGAAFARHHLDPVQPGGPGRLACLRGDARVALDQPSGDVAAAGVVGEHAEQVPPLPRAQADRPDLAGRDTVERLGR